MFWRVFFVLTYVCTIYNAVSQEHVTERISCGNDQWQCRDGACISKKAKCDGLKDCPDGSDEAVMICKSYNSTSKVCVLPPYPKHGSYNVPDAPGAGPGEIFDMIHLIITCNPGYAFRGSIGRYCMFGVWGENMTDCFRSCRVNKDPSIDYRCLINANTTRTRTCKEMEPHGAIIRPKCSARYFNAGVTILPFMHCVDGSWNYEARCTPECGRLTPRGVELTKSGFLAQRPEFPWHAGVYRKTTTPYSQICSGSLVSPNVVISAAHCFWDGLKALPASQFAVALGKMYLPWSDSRDEDVQRSDVKDIKIPVRIRGDATDFRDVIALLMLSDVVEYTPHIRPVCVDFDIVLEKWQLREGNVGMGAGWVAPPESEQPSPTLRVLVLPYVPTEKCLAASPPDVRPYITADKMCAGRRNDTTGLCKGGRGIGLSFPESERGVARHYLRGVASPAPDGDDHCDNSLATFTIISRHKNFIKKFI